MSQLLSHLHNTARYTVKNKININNNNLIHPQHNFRLINNVITQSKLQLISRNYHSLQPFITTSTCSITHNLRILSNNNINNNRSRIHNYKLNNNNSSRGFASASQVPISNIRNVAIIAHVDHGKTTLVDGLLRQSSTHLGDSGGVTRLMDSNPLEKERGITILAKCTTILWENEKKKGEKYQLNIVDTPGHADFGGEVERIMSMVDGVCLVVDAADGPMQQTKFVLGKALKKGLKPVVVINKVDRPSARLGEVENEIFDLFAALDATDEQMDFPIVYACAREAWATLDYKKPTNTMAPLFETIVKHVPPPPVNANEPFSMLITQIDHDPFVGKLLLGRVFTGKVKVGDRLKALDEQGKQIEDTRITRIQTRRGMDKVIVDEGEAGNIISLAGFSRATINSTLCDIAVNKAIPSIPIDPPSLSMVFQQNESPAAAPNTTNLQTIKARLIREAEGNPSIAIKELANGVEVRGRGELSLGVLIETMRREGMELSVSSPRVVYKQEKQADGTMLDLEPVEEITIDLEQQHANIVMDKMTQRKAELIDYIQSEKDGKSRLIYRIPLRGLLGFRSELSSDTSGSAVLNQAFYGYIAHVGEINRNVKGAMVSLNDGITTNFALEELQSRGSLFVDVGDKVYAGMVIGESNREFDVDVNPCKLKQLSNVRSVEKEEKTKLRGTRYLSLEQLIAIVRDDEIIEITKDHIRLRKAILDANVRKRALKQQKAKEQSYN